MKIQWIALGAATVGLAGFFVGKSVGPAPVRFPAPGEARSEAEMEQAITEALREPRAFVRLSSLARIYEGLTPENQAGAARAVAALSGRSDPVELQIFLSAWAIVDPLAAVEEVRNWPIRSRRIAGIVTVMREWAAAGDPIAAANYYETITDREIRDVAAGPLVRGWALSGDADGALALARTLWEKTQRLDVVDGYVRAILNTEGPTALLDRVRGVDPHGFDEFHVRLVRVSLNLAGREDPIAAARLYDEVARPERSGPLAGAMARIAGDWRTRDPHAALEWLMTKDESPERSEALTRTVGTWAIQDLDAAWAWFEKLNVQAEGTAPLDETQSALLTGLVRRMARTEPERASRWVGRLRDPSVRLEMSRRVAHFWSMQDPQATQRWIDALELLPDQRESLMEAARMGREAAKAEAAAAAQ